MYRAFKTFAWRVDFFVHIPFGSNCRTDKDEWRAWKRVKELLIDNYIYFLDPA